MLLHIPALILLCILIVVVAAVVFIVFSFGIYKAAEKKMADDVVSEKETERRSPQSDLRDNNES